MSEKITIPPPPNRVPGESMDGLDDQTSVAPVDFFGRLWRFFISMNTGLLLMLGLGLLSLIGTVLMQVPAEVAKDSAAHAIWLASARAKYGGWTSVLDTLGLFSVFSSLIFKTLLVLLTTSILACSMNRAPRLWKQATRPRLRMGESFFDYARLRGEVALATTGDEALQDVRGVFQSSHYRTITPEDDGEVTNLYVERFRWGPFGTVVAHLSFVLILVGAYFSATTGFRNDSFVIPVGSSTAVGHNTGLSVRANAFSSVYYPDGRPKDYSSELALYKNGKKVGQQTVRVNAPMRYDGVSFYQSYFGVASALKVTDKAGNVVFDKSVPLSFDTADGRHTGGQFDLPKQKLTVSAVVAASGKPDPKIQPGQVEIWTYRKGSEVPLEGKVISQGKPAQIAGLNFTFERTRQFTGLIVARDPGANLVWIGSSLLVFGIVVVFFFPYRRIWVRIEKTSAGSRVRVAAALRRDAAFQDSFQRLIDEIKQTDGRATGTRK